MPFISYNKKLMICDLFKHRQFHGENEWHLKEVHIDPDHSRISFAASCLTGDSVKMINTEKVFFFQFILLHVYWISNITLLMTFMSILM